jgi:hypothetical protein
MGLGGPQWVLLFLALRRSPSPTWPTLSSLHAETVTFANKLCRSVG